MYFRSHSFAVHTLAPLGAALLSLASLACSVESDSNGGEGDDDSGGSSTGGTSGTGGSAGSGTGGASGSGGMPAYCDAAFMPIDPTALIDDIEDGNALIAVSGGRNGSWWVSSDGTPEATIEPPSDAAPAPERILGMRCDSEYGMRITGQGFTNWGANLSLGFKYEGMPMPIDVSDFSGVMFWARIGETHSSPVRVQFQDSSTQPEGGVCNPEPGAADECYNGWGVELAPIGTEWRLYKIAFSRMTQRDFGYRADAIDTTALYDIEWGFQPNTVFDLWIDDVWFYE
jgi:hypothetical protein